MRNLIRCCGRAAFYTQRWSGGVPEALGATFIGPEVGESPETSELRKLKKSGDNERWILIRRCGATAIFKVQESSSIKSSGLFMTLEPGTLRGDTLLVDSLQGHDKVHLCRNEACSEEGPHFKQYAMVRNFNPESFQLANATTGAHQAGTQLLGWFRRGAVHAAKKAKDMASESETEDVPCLAHRIRWEEDRGGRVLSDERCTAVGTEVQVLEEDLPPSVAVCTMCPKHMSAYLSNRFQLKCAVTDCLRLGHREHGGLRFCSHHEDTTRQSSRRSSRSRSRTRDRGDEEPQEGEKDEGLRRRVRHEKEVEEIGDKTERFLDEVRGVADGGTLGRSRKRGVEESSPGRTPKSAVQRSLARLGMVNSPDRRDFVTTLEEFMAQFVDGKELGLEEEDVRVQMAAASGMSLPAFTQILYDQALEEQRKGTKGLTKFLAKWRKQLAASKASTTVAPTPPGSWSLVGSPEEEKPEGGVGTPKSLPTSVSSRPSSSLAVLGPPGIYGASDRKAGTGTGGEAGMADLAKAIQHQTAELASLVKSQHEAAPTTNQGTVKSLGRVSEELVYLMRACGQYTVEVGENEYGANLANALMAAQAGASTRLRNAGFRQKVTNRLAVGVAGPFWGTQEKFALSAADFKSHVQMQNWTSTL